MDVGAILSRSFSLYRRNLVLVLPHLIVTAISLLVLLVFTLFTALILYWILGSLTITSLMSLLTGPTPFLFIAYLIFGIMAILMLSMILGAHARAAIIGMVIEAEKNGKTSLNTGIESAKKNGLKIFGYVVTISFVPAIVIMFIGAIIVFISVFVISLADPSGGAALLLMALVFFVMLLFFLAYIVIYVLALFSPQKIVIEECGIIDGIRKSIEFVRGHPTEVVIYIGVAFAVVVVTSVVSMVFAIPRIIFQMMDSQFIAIFLQIFETIISTVISLLIAPYLETVKTLLVIEGDNEGEPKSSA
jgi:hypothetical protein